MEKNYQNTDSLILGIKAIIQNRCSLSDEEVKLLNDVILELQRLKRKRGKKKVNFDLAIKIVELLTKFLLFNQELSKITHH